MDLSELKRLREEKLLEHKRKKRAYYLKSKMNKKQKDIKKVNSIDYQIELFGGDFTQKLKDIAQKQKKHIDSREILIKQKIEEYRSKKQKYYKEHKKTRLEYDKEYRDKKKEKLKEYRREYYKKNKEKILLQQKQNRLNKKLEN
ncbi:MAG: hypothetical protein CSA86_03065 [Arcobacter sp.]|nr:MAG: hypothetical protein CSA86_03065 [Arcobacter sp.]